MQACTIVTRNRLAFARSLAESLLEHHADLRLTTLVVDDTESSIEDELFDVVRPADLDLADDEFDRLAAMYEPLQLCCALKPSLLLHMLSPGETSVLYLDADIEIFASLAELGDLAEQHAVVLTPHLTEPTPDPIVRREEMARFHSGSFNAGLIAVGPTAGAFLEWWRRRLARYCIHAPDSGYFDDQRWLDLAPTYFEHHILRSPAYNVAFWNVASRPVHWDGNEYSVCGEQLRCFHFGGFDVERPHLLSKWLGSRPHTLLSEQPQLRRLCRDYADRVHRHGHEHWSNLTYGFSTARGAPLERHTRSSYRTAVLKAEAQLEADPPNPLRSGIRPVRPDGSPGRVLSEHHPPARIVREHMRRIPTAVGMSWTWERAYCHWYALRLYSGEGEIVDLGCWAGSLTAALAMGLRGNPSSATRGRRVHAFDAFRWTTQMNAVATETALEGMYEPGDSFRDAFERQIAPWRELVEVHEGDLEATVWGGDPIEFLLVDAMKSWGLANAILRGFFPRLVPGQGLILHQDFAHRETYWIHLMNFKLRAYLEVAYDIPWASGMVFRLKESIPAELIEEGFSREALDAKILDDAFEHAFSLTTDRKRPDVAAAKVMALLDIGDVERARLELERWSKFRLQPSTELPLAAQALARYRQEGPRSPRF